MAKGSNDDMSSFGDILDAVVIYNKDNGNMKKFDNDVIDVEDFTVGKKSNRSSSRNNRDNKSSADKQLGELATQIISSDTDNIAIRKKISKILKTGDPILESRSVMVTLARKELSKIIRLMDAIDRIEDNILTRIENGQYDDGTDFEIGLILERLEKSMGRGMQIVQMVTDNKDYAEFLSSYRDELVDDEELSHISDIGKNKDSRQKLRDLMVELKNKM